MRRVVLAGLSCLLVPPVSEAAAARSIVVVSDLHLGDGEAGEDFRWAPDFAVFLDAVASEGGVDLIFNGDTFELASASELQTRLDAHEEWFRSVERFARQEDNRVVLVPGHTDRALTETPIDGLIVAERGHWSSEDGAVVVEHGSHDRVEDLEWERAFYLRQEPEFPLVDNVAALGAGIAFVLAEQQELLDPLDVASLLRLSVARRDWQQFRSDLEIEVEPPLWDIEAIRSEGETFIVEAFAEGTPLRALTERAEERGALGLSLEDLSDEMVASLCDYRAAVRRARRRLEKWLTQLEPLGPPGRECPRLDETRGAAYQYFWRSRDEALAKRLSSFERVPRVYVTGHTHVPHRPFDLEIERGGKIVSVVNSGAWSRTVTPAELAAKSREEGRSARDLLRSLTLEDLPACYPFVTIRTGESLELELRYWTRGEGGFRIERSCS